MKRRKVMWLLATTGFLLLQIPQHAFPQNALPKGVILFKSSSLDRSDAALALEYLSIQNAPIVLLIETVEGKKMTIQRNRFVELIEYPDVRTIQSAPQIKAVNETTQKLSRAQSAYPLAVNVITPRLNSFNEALNQLNKGFIRVGGVWQLSGSSDSKTRAAPPPQVSKPPVMPGSAVLESNDSQMVDSSGKVYYNVKILSVEPNGIKIQHTGGILKLAFENLPQELRNKYNYSKDASDAYALKEAEVIRQNRLASSVRGKIIAELVRGEFSKEFFGISKDKSITIVSGTLSENELKTTTNVSARANALGGAGLPNVSTSTEKVLKNSREIKVIGKLEELKDTGGEVVLYPILLEDPSALFSITLEQAVLYSLAVLTSNLNDSVDQSEYLRMLGLSEYFSVEVIQATNEGYLVSRRTGEFSTESYFLKGFPNLAYAKGDELKFFGVLSKDVFTYTSVLNAQITVRVIESLSYSIN